MPQFPAKIGLPDSNRRLIEGLRSGLIRDPMAGTFFWRQRVRLADLTLPAATNGTFTFATEYPRNLFPQRVVRKSLLVYVVESVVGPSISAATLIVGDTDDPNGLLESSAGDIFDNDGAVLQHVAAAQNADRYEEDYSADGFCFRIDTTGANLSVMTALDLLFIAEYSPSLFIPEA